MGLLSDSPVALAPSLSLPFTSPPVLNPGTIPSPVVSVESPPFCVTSFVGEVITISIGEPPSIVVFSVFLTPA